ncbi:MAG: ABC transporter permease [Proteobacteria bacterium]|nr:ABC transporter permease [Pseudomonadota bacterium]
MWAYILRRLLYGVLIMLGVTGIIFLLLGVFGGDPVLAYLGKSATEQEILALKREFGLDKPLFAQYLDYLGQVATLDFGQSWTTKESVSDLIRRGVWPSLSFTLPALLLTTFLAVCVGIGASFFRGRAPDRGLMAIAVLGMSISFLVYIVVFQYLLAYVFPIFHIHGYEAALTERWQYLALPIIIMVIVGLGYESRFYRSVFVEEVVRDHVTTAYAKGASRYRVMFIHVLKNALIPIITRVMISVPFLVTGSLLIEAFFGVPGLGNALLSAIETADFPVIRALTALIAVIFVLSTILNDILYAVVDPRVRLE